MSMIYKVCVVVREACGIKEIPLRVYDEYEDAERSRLAYMRRNPGTVFIIEHKFSESGTSGEEDF